VFKGPGSRLLIAAAGLFIIFTIHVVVGKIAILNGATTVPGLGDVGEALLLFAAVCLFVAAVIKRESATEHARK